MDGDAGGSSQQQEVGDGESSSSSSSASAPPEASSDADAEGQSITSTGDDEVMSAVADTVNTNEAIKEDIEIAWEVLEVARTILSPLYERNVEENDVRTMLALTHLKLGDVQKLNGKFADAAKDYECCLRLRLSFMKAPAREVAASHHSIASACEYGTAEEELREEQRNEMREKSVTHYRACIKVYQAMISKIKGEEVADVDEDIEDEGSSTNTSLGKGKAKAVLLATPAADDNSTFGSASVPLAAHDANTASGDVTDTSPKSVLSTLSAEAQAEVQDYQEIIDELNETISALEANRGLVSEMVKDALPTGDAALSGGDTTQSTMGVTTIGFGASSSSSFPSSSSSAGVTTIGFGGAASSSSSSFSSSSSSSSSNAPTMMVKKKKRAIQPIPVTVPQANTAHASLDAGEASAKKAKPDC